MLNPRRWMAVIWQNVHTTMIGQSLGRYEIVAELGRGAMGIVYKARDPIIERHLAIKTLRADFPEDQRAAVRERFLREARSAGKLSHPAIVVIHDVGESDGVAYLAMEFLQGESLQALLAKPDRLPLYTIAELAAQIADGLDYAQRHGIVHRDVKPANIMVSPLGLAKLTDFGIAYVPSSTATQTGMVLGSPKYMSPEQVMGEAIDGRSDVFSLGIVLYEMLTGRTPFERPSDTNIYGLMQRIVADPHPRPSEVDREIPHGFDVILARALSKDPARRYQRAGEMANDLRNYRSFSAGADATQVLTRGPAMEQTLVMPAPGATVAMPLPEPAPAPRVEPPPPAPAKPAPPAPEVSQLLADLDSFADSIEDQQRRLAEEEEAKKRAESEARARNFDMKIDVTLAGPAAEQLGAAVRASEPPPVPKGGVLGMLRERSAAAAPAKPAAPVVPPDTVDRQMRALFRYVQELARELEAGNPPCERRIELPYVGALPPLAYASAFADFRTQRSASEKSLCERVLFSGRLQAQAPSTIDLVREEVAVMRAELDAREFDYELVETRNDFGQLARGRFAIAASLPVNMEFVASYATGRVRADLRNIGVWGAATLEFEVAEIGEAFLEGLGLLVLGMQSPLGARLVLKKES